MPAMVDAAWYALFGLGFLGCAAYAVIATIVHFFGKR